MAAFKKRFLAILPENSNLRGFPNEEASELSDWYLSRAVVSEMAVFLRFGYRETKLSTLEDGFIYHAVLYINLMRQWI